MTLPKLPPRPLTADMRRALDAIETHRGIGRGELTPTEKRTATALVKRGLLERDGKWYVATPAGRAALASTPGPRWLRCRSLDELDE